MIDIKSKVVCIDDENWPAWAKAVMTDFPVKGKTYVVRQIQQGVLGEELIKDTTGKNPLQFKGRVIPVVLLEEIKNPVHPVSKQEMGYSILRFAEIPEQPKEKVKEKIKNPGPPKTVKPKKPKKKELQTV